jgi:hypothetical protein
MTNVIAAAHEHLRRAEWSERLTANAEVATVRGSIPAYLRQSGI